MWKVIYKHGRLQVAQPAPASAWKPVERDPSWKPADYPRCTCGDLAAWQHPSHGFRCITCPRPR
jgi:hypothetical protein